MRLNWWISQWNHHRFGTPGTAFCQLHTVVGNYPWWLSAIFGCRQRLSLGAVSSHSRLPSVIILGCCRRLSLGAVGNHRWLPSAMIVGHRRQSFLMQSVPTYISQLPQLLHRPECVWRVPQRVNVQKRLKSASSQQLALDMPHDHLELDTKCGSQGGLRCGVLGQVNVDGWLFRVCRASGPCLHCCASMASPIFPHMYRFFGCCSLGVHLTD